jgi:hypothetical protein
MAVSESEIQISPAERALVLGIQIFRFVGGLLLVFFFVEFLSSLADLRLRNPAAELRFASQMTDRLPLGLLGFAFLLCHPRFLRKKPEAMVLRILATLPLVLSLGYLLLIPLTMLAAANYFRNATYGLEQQVEEQVKKVRAVRDATLNLSPDQQQAMVERYNRANPKKQPVDLPGFLKTLNDEVKASESKLEQERRSVIGTQQRSLYASQFVQSLKILAGSTALFFLWKLTGWARPAGQTVLRTEVGASRHRRD